jgi:hypothetical protein
MSQDYIGKQMPGRTEKLIEAFAIKMRDELGEDLALDADERSLIFAHIFNCLWDPLEQFELDIRQECEKAAGEQ